MLQQEPPDVAAKKSPRTVSAVGTFLVAMSGVPVVQDLQDNTPGSSTIVGRF